jgi:hypothetical protein
MDRFVEELFVTAVHLREPLFETQTLANIYSPWTQSVGLLRVGLILCIYLQTNLLLIVVHVDGVRSCR